ncbi:MAG TPA: aspartate--tRNA(Asn) ligase [Geobacterales bacterium]|nr:aspartate--tRNA(Asn) ligase [Geobacterales bacterium]
MKKYYIKDIASLENTSADFYGWVHEIRETKPIIFIILRDSTGKAQVTVKKSEHKQELLEKVSKLHHEDVIRIRGKVIRSQIAKLGYEIIPEDIEILAKAKHPLPIDVSGKIDAELPKILDARYISLRREEYFYTFKIQSVLVKNIRDFLYSRGFVEIFTPKIIRFATEGGAELFKVDYFGKDAYLAQSPQIYKEMCAGVFEKVFEIAQYYRAEKSRTNYHLAEFISFDVECAFYSYEDIMDLLEELLKYAINRTYEEAKEYFDKLGLNALDLNYKFERMSYDEAIDHLKDKGYKWGDDIPQLALSLLSEKIGQRFYFIKDWPSSLRPFYTKEHENDPRITRSFDLNFGFLEIASGGERVNKSEVLIEKLKRNNLNVENFDIFIKALDVASPPHAGFGLGISRLLMMLTAKKNIREAVLFPRDVDRLVP